VFYVYIIQNILNNKIYVGKTNRPLKRFAEHNVISNNINHRGFGLIHRAIRKYGKHNFTYQIIEEWYDEQNAYDAEEFWIEFFRSCVTKFGKNCGGYNLDVGGAGAKSGPLNPMFGKTHSPKTKAKMSAQRKGELNANFGKHFSKESKQIMREKKIDIYNGEGNPRALLTNEQVKEIRIKYETGKYSTSELADEYKVSRKVIWKIITNQTYRINNG